MKVPGMLFGTHAPWSRTAPFDVPVCHVRSADGMFVMNQAHVMACYLPMAPFLLTRLSGLSICDGVFPCCPQKTEDKLAAGPRSVNIHKTLYKWFYSKLICVSFFQGVLVIHIGFLIDSSPGVLRTGRDLMYVLHESVGES